MDDIVLLCRFRSGIIRSHFKRAYVLPYIRIHGAVLNALVTRKKVNSWNTRKGTEIVSTKVIQVKDRRQNASRKSMEHS
jgi:hypothetical protein